MADTTVLIGTPTRAVKLIDNGNDTYSVAHVTPGYGSRQSAARPNDTTAYGAGDCVGAAMTFPVGPASGGEVLVTSALLEIDVAAIPAGMTTFDLKFYNVTPSSALADNAVWNIPAGDRTAYLDCLTFDLAEDKGDTLLARYSGPPVQVTLLSANLFAYLVTNAAYTPSALAVKACTLHTLRV